MLAQLCMFNAKKRRNVQNNNQRKNLARELAIPIYLGLRIHKETRDKKLIEKLYQLGLNISYDRRQIELKTVSNIMSQNKLKSRI